jgi:hypothetical protein
MHIYIYTYIYIYMYIYICIYTYIHIRRSVGLDVYIICIYLAWKTMNMLGKGGIAVLTFFLPLYLSFFLLSTLPPVPSFPPFLSSFHFLPFLPFLPAILPTFCTWANVAGRRWRFAPPSFSPSLPTSRPPHRMHAFCFPGVPSVCVCTYIYIYMYVCMYVCIYVLYYGCFRSLTEIVARTSLMFLTELVRTVLLFPTELARTLLIFLTEVVRTVLTFPTESFLAVLSYAELQNMMLRRMNLNFTLDEVFRVHISISIYTSLYL